MIFEQLFFTRCERFFFAQIRVKFFVGFSHRDVVVVFLHVCDALLLHNGNAFGVLHKCFELGVNTLKGGCNVDDGTKLCFVENAVVLGFATSHTHNAIVHGLQRIHAWHVAIKLVEDDVAALHHLAILRKG